MSRLPAPVDVHPDAYPVAMRLRIETLHPLIDQLDETPILQNVVALHASHMVDLITTACGNSARGTNIVPHLLTSLDGLADDLRKVLNHAAHH